MSAPQTLAEPAKVSLFQPITLGARTFKNRLWLSPMCQYSAEDGVPGQWHLVHLGARAKGGFGLIFAEATAISPEARISLGDTGLWNDRQEQAWANIVDFVHERGTKIGIQLSHAGRKASLRTPWDAEPGALPVEEGGWTTLSASPIAFPGSPEPSQATGAQLEGIVDDFASSAVRARGAGFDVVEIQAGHGFLLHSFLSPLSNERTDQYGGSLRNRAKLLLDVVEAVKEVLGPTGPSLFVRLSATDWLEHGLTVHDTADVSAWLRERGVDLVDVSSGGLLPADIPLGPGYQVPLAQHIAAKADVPVAAVGLITSPQEAEEIVASGTADAVFVGRAGLADPGFGLRAAHELGHQPAEQLWQKQYVRAIWK
ncbi:NADH:flavin oxidoreductase/NADH oxidase [Paenarthrobacter sp. NPDC018779]|uniref:NADH:flavin oxidoreductase/NADH oxidase n=1 Tax=Paenarthrobacter sp. NPDC018779 TaxID=3364375 RepID=UPI0037CA0C48